MLKVKEILPEKIPAIVETDFYVPITVEYPLNDLQSEEIYYYRILNEKSSFIELKVNSNSHKIYSVIVVSINDLVDYSEINYDFNKLPVNYGNPIIDTIIWSDINTIDDNNNFIISIDSDKIFILLDNFKQATERLILPNVELLLDKDDYIVGYILYDIPLENKEDMMAGIVATVTRHKDVI